MGHAYSSNDTLSNDTKVNDLVTLTLTLKLKIAFWTSLPPGAYTIVFHKHTFIFWGYNSIHRKTITVIPYHLIFNASKMLQSTSAVKVANGVAIDVAYDVLPVWWMEVYPFHFNQSISLLHAEIK